MFIFILKGQGMFTFTIIALLIKVDASKKDHIILNKL